FMKSKKLLVVVLVLVMIISAGTMSFAETDYEKFELFIDYIENYYYRDVTRDEIMEDVYKAMFNSLDNHSAYFSKEEYSVFTEDTEGSFGGIGVTITTEDGYVKVIQMYEDAPAMRSGMQVDDLIIKVDGEEIIEIPLDVAASKIRGEIGTDVTLTILRNGQEIDIVVTRGLIVIKNVEYEILDGNIGYLKITRFAENIDTEVHDAVREFIQNHVNGIIVDLRNNPGGRVDTVVKVSELFLPKDAPILQIDYRAYKDEMFKSNINGIQQPMVVLVNRSSASASEIFASAMQDNDRAIIIGETTYGKGTVQSVIPLNDESGFKMTIAEYLSGKGNTIDGVGVVPDVEISKKNIINNNFAPLNQKRDIYLGEVSLNVYGVQQRLNALGNDLDEDGIFGNNTLEAIKNFQRANHLSITGRLDVKTVCALESLISNSNDRDIVLDKAVELLR
ncbi:MAG: S41 family peptidase, partial [Clostridiales bacterium]|nr:S41 family peptidase [Clostridiales bacterium]